MAEAVLVATCPECHARFKVQEEAFLQGGYKLNCPSCQYVFVAQPGELMKIEPSPPARLLQQASGQTILIVEDTDLFRGYISDILVGAGYRVIALKSAAEVLAALEEERPDLILTDLLLPGIHGFDLCQQIKKQYPSLPVIMMTGVYKSLQYQLEGRWKYGADDFILKPFSPEELLGKIKRVLAKRAEPPSS